MNVVFLDRDGTVIAEPPDERVDSVEKIKLFPDTIEALRHFAEHDFAIILITNQAGISEGRINHAEFNRINSSVLKKLEPSGASILKTYVCPHGPDDGCDCHKPGPKMLLQAANDFDLALKDIFMVGDRQSDIMAGVNAGTKTVLVKTANMPVTSVEATFTANTLLDAARFITSS
jgi:D-glycero-D-manno-heptose 1,7-bisphosphate phosphatase